MLSSTLRAVARARPPTRTLLSFAVPLAYAPTLWLVASHHAAGAHESHELPLLLHWLRDSTLAFPGVAAAVWIALVAVTSLSRGPLPGWRISALSTATAAAAALAAGMPVHARLFGAGAHHDTSLLAHMLGEGGSAFAVALPLAAATAWLGLGRGRSIPRAELRVLAAAAATLVLVVVSGVAAWSAHAHELGFSDSNPEASQLRDKVSPCFNNSPVAPPFSVKLPIPPVANIVPSADVTADNYRIAEVRGETEIIPGIKTPIWGYADASTSLLPLSPGLLVASSPGPTILARRGRAVNVTFHNQLPPNEDPSGIVMKTELDAEDHPSKPSSTVVHAHGLNTDHDSDGFADFTNGHEHRKDPGQSFTHNYPNNQNNRAATHWYHDHSVHVTSTHVYRGLAGFYILEDPQEDRLNLPKGYGAHDIPLAVRDVMIAGQEIDGRPRGTLVYDNCSHMGAYGDVMTVNGKQQPSFDVGTRKYRFRILNASDARQYWFALRPANRIDDPTAEIPFFVIGTDQGLLPAPELVKRVHIAPAERYDIVVDFAAHLGRRLVLVNTLIDGFDPKLTPIMAFDVTRAEVDESTVPPVLSEDHVVEPPAQFREFRFDRSGGYWAINSLVFDPERPDAKPLLDTTEQWHLINKSGGWGHPIHLHLGKFKIVEINGRPARPGESGWKDTVWLGPNQTVKVVHEFRTFTDKFVFHCHNGSHEDHDMMSTFEVQPRTGQ